MMSAVRIILAIAFTLRNAFQAPALIVITTLCCVAVAYCYVMYQPFHSFAVNHYHGAGCAVLLWACFCLILLQLRDQPEVRSPWAVIPILTCIVLIGGHRHVLLAILLIPASPICAFTAQNNVEAFLLILGGPSVAYFGYGLSVNIVARVRRESRGSPANNASSTNPYLVRAPTIAAR